MRNKSSSVYRWNNMDYDILVKIFMSLNVMDLISVVSQVCSSWRSACCDPILWKKLDLCIQISDSCIYAPLQSDAWSYSVSNNNRLMNILKTTSNLSQGNVTRLIFNFFEYVEDEHLVYAAKRNRNLKRLALPIWSRLTVRGRRKAFKYWKGLESLTIPDFKSPMKLMKATGTNCKNFSELKLTCNLNLDYALLLSMCRSLRCSVFGPQ
ncbi:f-box/lrr-repeat protein [Quercus suber]|uniref:F-box/lrr-repeat protein n=1 Tax=Quercus suber TaxID=58331 RepID=A0AAW0KPL7_QUESU|nr:f-box/lrr-repeat protein [Quercus suber]